MARSVTLPPTITALGMLLVAATLLACSGPTTGGPVSPSEQRASPPASLAGNPQGSQGPGATETGLCGLFTPAELGSFLGAEPAPGSGGGPLESLCQWDAGEAFVMIQKVPPDYFEDARGAEEYRKLDGIGDYAFVASHPFGRITSARTADAAYVVIASEGADEAGQIEMLRTFIERSPGAPGLSAPEPPAESNAPDSSGSAGSTECAVSTEEVSEATGIEMIQVEGCTWAAADMMTLFEVILREQPISLFEHLRSEELVPALGDEAYADTTGALYVRVGDRAVSINVITLSLDEREALDIAVAIARRAVERLR